MPGGVAGDEGRSVQLTAERLPCLLLIILEWSLCCFSTVPKLLRLKASLIYLLIDYYYCFFNVFFRGNFVFQF